MNTVNRYDVNAKTLKREVISKGWIMQRKERKDAMIISRYSRFKIIFASLRSLRCIKNRFVTSYSSFPKMRSI